MCSLLRNPIKNRLKNKWRNMVPMRDNKAIIKATYKIVYPNFCHRINFFEFKPIKNESEKELFNGQMTCTRRQI